MADEPAAASTRNDSGDGSRGDSLESGKKSSTITVLLAGGANLAIAVAKLFAGLLSGSSALLSESAHSFADTLNQVFLMAALRRSDRPADREHPFGYGKERYLWSLLAAVAVFVLGAGFSVLEGIKTLVEGGGGSEGGGQPVIAYAVLGFAFCFEGTSLLRGLWQLRHQARGAGHGLLSELSGADPTLRGVVFEDSAAVFGVVVAGLGTYGTHTTGSPVYDGIASLLIGASLVGVAWATGRWNQEQLIGRAVAPEMLRGIRREVEGADGIAGVLELLTMQLSPEEVLLAARVDVEDAATGEQLERVADEVEERVRGAYPQVRHVFLDPTPGKA